MDCLTNEKYQYYCKVLEDELVPAMGCTEPIAIAYAAAKAKQVLGVFPEECSIAVSGNIIKNAKSVVVPHTGSMRGIEAAVIAGLVSENSDAELEVLSSLNESDIEKMKAIKESLPITLSMADSDIDFDIQISLRANHESSFVRIATKHTNIVLIKKNEEVLFEDKIEPAKEIKKAELSVKEIIEFADTLNVCDVKEVLDRQIEYNMAIANAGLSGNYGANIGKVYLSSYSNDISIKAKAYTAAGSDARMNGCELPVI